MPATFPHAAKLDLNSSSITFGTPAGLTNVGLRDIIMLAKFPDGMTSYRHFLRKGDNDGNGGWAFKANELYNDDGAYVYGYYRGATSGNLSGTTYVGPVASYRWLHVKLNKATGAWVINSGPKGGAITNVARSTDENNSVGGGADDSAYDLRIGDKDGANVGLGGLEIAFIGAWHDLDLTLAQVQSRCDDMDTGLASASLFAKATSSSGASFADLTANGFHGTPSSVSVVAGPDPVVGGSSFFQRYIQQHITNFF